MATRLDIIAELLLEALARPIPPERVGFVYVRRGGDGEGIEELVEQPTRKLADAEAKRLEKRLGCEPAFVREHKAPPDVPSASSSTKGERKATAKAKAPKRRSAPRTKSATRRGRS